MQETKFFQKALNLHLEGYANTIQKKADVHIFDEILNTAPLMLSQVSKDFLASTNNEDGGLLLMIAKITMKNSPHLFVANQAGLAVATALMILKHVDLSTEDKTKLFMDFVIREEVNLSLSAKVE